MAFLTGRMPRGYKTIVIDPLNVSTTIGVDHFEVVEWPSGTNKFAIWLEAAKKTTVRTGSSLF